MMTNAAAEPTHPPQGDAALPRIAFITAQYDNVQSGPGTFAAYLRNAVEAGELDITFFSDDIDTATRPYEHPVRLPVTLPSPTGQFIRQTMYYRAVLAAHARHPFDVIWYNSSYASFVATASNPPVPTVVMVNDYTKAMSIDMGASVAAFGRATAIKNRFWRPFEKATLRAADQVVVNSNYMRQIVQDHYGISSEKIRLLYKAVNLDMFRRDVPHTFFEGDALRVLFVKSHWHLGGLTDVLRALAELDISTSLTVIGPKPHDNDLIRTEAAAAGYTGTLDLRGRVSRDAIAEAYHTHDVLCVPSRSEALGVVFMEGLASGIPTVGTAVGGIPEVMADGRAGWLVPASNPSAIVDAIREIVTDAEARTRKVGFGEAHVAMFEYENMLQQFKAILYEVVPPGR